MACVFHFIDANGTTLPGISGQMHFNTGILPSAADITYAALDLTNLTTPNGTLVICDGVNGTIEFTDAYMESAQSDLVPGETTTTARVLDRRWRWAGLAPISGEYNIRDKSGQRIIETGYTKVSAYGLGSTLLEAMNETSYTIDLPDGTDLSAFPYTNWKRENPAQALEVLCQQYGRRVCMDATAPNSVRICAMGTGGTLSGTLGAEARIVYKNDYSQPRPEFIRIIGADRRFPQQLELTAVALGTDYTVQPWSNVSYLATRKQGTIGWPNDIALALRNATGTASGSLSQVYAEMCDRSWCRWYRLPDTIDFAHGSDSYTIPRELYMRGLVLETNSYGTAEGQTRWQKGYISGTYVTDKTATGPDFLYGIDNESGSTAAERRALPSYQVDTTRGLVVFSEPVYDISRPTTRNGTFTALHGHITEPTLYLNCVVEWDESALNVPTEISGTQSGYIVSEYHADFQYIFNGTAPATTPANGTDMDALAESYALEATLRIMDKSNLSAHTDTYAGMHNCVLDGVTSEVTWVAGIEQAPLTVVSRNTQHSYGQELALRQNCLRTQWAYAREQARINEAYLNAFSDNRKAVL